MDHEDVEGLAGSVGASDVFVLRRITGKRYVHVGGLGRGEGWAGLVDVDLAREPWLAAAVASGEHQRRDDAGTQALLGPYYGTSAVAVSVGTDTIVVFATPVGRVGTPDAIEGWHGLANVVADAVHAVSPAKALADELEIMHALRDLATDVPDTFPEALTHVVRCVTQALSCELGLIWWRETGDVTTVADGWIMPGDAPGHQRVLADLGERHLPHCTQDLARDPIGDPFTPLEGCRSAYALPIGDDAGVLLLVHTDGGPRGFTNLCRELGRKLGIAAEGVLREVGARAHLQDEIDRAYHLARQDPLTGLGNRRVWDEALEEEPRRLERTGRTSIVLADVVALKAINDRHGLTAGDEVIRTAAAVLASAVRDLDLVARVGGDEFALLLPGLGPDGCETVVRRIQSLMAECRGPASEPLAFTLGWAHATPDTDLAEVIAAADEMLRANKAHHHQPSVAQPG